MVVVGLSGGADSVYLLYWLLREGHEVLAVHVNHGLRGEEADEDERFCVALCKSLGVEIEVVRANAAQMAKTRRLTVEEAGRELRYNAFYEAATRRGAAEIAVAHNANDQAETVLMRLLRGAGVKGLGGIPPVNGKVVRPLLDVWRADIEKFLAVNNIEYRVDSTNTDLSFTRNKIRNELIPYLQREFNPLVCDALINAGKIFRSENDYMEQAARAAFERCREKGKIDVAALKSEHPAIQRRVVMLAVLEAGVDKDVTSVHIERVMGLLGSQSGRRVPLVNGVYAECSVGWLTFFEPRKTRDTRKKTEQGQIIQTVKIGGTELELRERRAGDVFRANKNVTKKLKDYLIERRIPTWERERLFCLAVGNKVLWFGNAERTIDCWGD